MKITGAVLREPNKGYTIEELELDPPKEKEVLIKYVYTGYCHSDLHLLKGEIPIALPLVAGHEGAGVIEDVGPGVTKVKKGDHVGVTWMIPCGECPQCRRGMGNISSGNFPAGIALAARVGALALRAPFVEDFEVGLLYGIRDLFFFFSRHHVRHGGVFLLFNLVQLAQ